MMKLHDYLPSQNAWKVRLLMNHLGLEYETVEVSIFEGKGQSPEFLAMNPAGAVPVLELDDGRTLAESNAILVYLADGTRFLPGDAWARAQVARWMFFEEDFIQNGLAALRHWILTGKAARRSAEAVEGKRQGAMKSLRVLEHWLSRNAFLAAEQYTIADMAMFGYVGFAHEAELPMTEFPAVQSWIERVRSQEGFLDRYYPYSIDPHSSRELP